VASAQHRDQNRAYGACRSSYALPEAWD
jgi:hypothetical protein